VKDITAKVGKMPRNSAVLYKHTSSKDEPDPPAYLGVIRLEDGQLFWAAIWGRTVNRKQTVELQLKRKI
jgi:hypothetical protein